MVALSALWLPILLAAVIVFVASSIIHMILPYHKINYPPLPDEAKTPQEGWRENKGPEIFGMITGHFGRTLMWPTGPSVNLAFPCGVFISFGVQYGKW